MTDETMSDIKICNSFCAWIDLLGYGKPFYGNNWDLTGPVVEQNLRRIQKLDMISLSVIEPFFEKQFTLNDGFIINLDYDNILNPWLIINWFESLISKFYLLDKTDIESGFYGARGVLAYGQRAQYRASDAVGLDEYFRTSEERKTKFHDNKIVYSPKELQMNTAFSKSSLIENAGGSNVAKNELNITEEFIVEFVKAINKIGKDDIPGVTVIDENGNITSKDEPETIEYFASFADDRITIKTSLNGADYKDDKIIELKEFSFFVDERHAIHQKLYIPVSISYMDGDKMITELCHTK